MEKQQLTFPTLYTLERQTQSNKETNKNKQSHLTDRSLFYHEERKNNRAASMRSRAQLKHSNHMQVRIEATNQNNRRSGTIV